MDALRSVDPARIGPFTLLARLGAGGMGRVYLGRSPGGRLVAVKVIREDIAEHPEAMARFRREVATVRAVRSAWTANLVDASLDAPPHWLATEYVPGPTLLRAVKGAPPMAAGAAAGLFAALAEALADVHRYGVVHRDLKLHNIILAPTGPRLIDFGIARADGHTALTRTGQAPGTPGYTAPELLTGGEAGPAADVFALGATMARTVTGRPPYGSGEWAAVSYRVVHGEIDVAGVEPWLAGLIRDCVARDPERRPGLRSVIERCGVTTALADTPAYRVLASGGDRAPSDLATATAAGLVPPGHGGAGEAAPQPVPTPTQLDAGPWRSRSRTGAVAAGVAAAAVLVGVALWVLPGSDPGGEEASQGEARVPETGETDRAEAPDRGTEGVSGGGEEQGQDAGRETPGEGSDEGRPGDGDSGTGTGTPPRLDPGLVVREFWSPSTGFCNLPPEQRNEHFQWSVSADEVSEGTARIGWRLSYDSGQLSSPYYVAMAVRPPSEGGGSSHLGAVFLSEPEDLFDGTPEEWAYATYPDDFPDALPLTEDPGAWTVVYFHVQSSEQYESIACDGFTVP
ncbi:hypothetical protein GCM10009716_44930 [Streptomyces sodiiphilus]|uniref:Protein kinase domain-containing protein n=1 Tax=Streptomyces sodiiphilus TaxID=226217 RepID=A0ABN2PUU5_9ACTN